MAYMTHIVEDGLLLEHESGATITLSSHLAGLTANDLCHEYGLILPGSGPFPPLQYYRSRAGVVLAFGRDLIPLDQTVGNTLHWRYRLKEELDVNV